MADGFRPDVEGLRAAALAVVLLTHAGVSGVQGGYAGVDVFFVISGYLITRMILGEMARDGSVSLARFYARRAKRLLPLAFAVLVAVAVLSALFLSPVREELAGRDIVASALYVVNWHFATESVDYFAGIAGLDVSPVQHFWTLSIEEQFYLLWPTLLIAASWWRRRRGRDPLPAVALAIAAVATASFGYALHQSLVGAPEAYFSTPARAWEFTVGGALALLPAGAPVPRPAATALAWSGLVAILGAAVVFDDDTPAPGLATLMPTAGAAAIILAGATTLRTAPARLLQLPPVRYMGRISYSWYLWHWPPIVFAGALWGGLAVPARLAIILASAVPAILSHHLIERPFHRSQGLSRVPARGLRLGFACSTTGVLVGLLLIWGTPSVPTLPEQDAAGAAVLPTMRQPQERADALRPAPRHATRDRSRVFDDGCLVPARDETSPACVYGDRRSRTTVVLFGDSEAMHWFPGLQRVSVRRHWRLVALTKAACPPPQTHLWSSQLRRPYDQCDVWRERALRRIEQREHPAMVLATSATAYAAMDGKRRLSFIASRAALQRGYVRTLHRLRATGAKILLIGDTPRAPMDIPDCVSRSLHHLRRCAFDQRKATRRPLVNESAAQAVRGVRLLKPGSALCPGGLCPAVIGDVLVYRDTHHLTATYARTLAPWLAHHLPKLRATE